ncbi:3200_t:CDS:2, partial [Scutellospora calospora]
DGRELTGLIMNEPINLTKYRRTKDESHGRSVDSGNAIIW